MQDIPCSQQFIEIVSGQPFENFLLQNVFNPCKMKSTGYPWEQRLNTNLFAIGYDKNKQPIKPQENIWAARGPGNLMTSTEDLYRWINAIRNPRSIPPDIENKIFYDYIPGKETYSWNKTKTTHNTRLYYKGGGRADFENQIMWFPDEEVIVIFSINNNYNIRRILFSKILEEMN